VARAAAAGRYDETLAPIERVRRPSVLNGNDHVWHLYVVRVPDRDAVADALREAAIGVGVHYPVPIHLQEAFRDLGHRAGDFPVAEEAAGAILSLPMYPHLSAGQQERVVDALRQAVS
jgi:dTDP-4-amino-4,6-dideoxygalactose transaminase